VPWWAAFEDYAEKLRMTIPELLAWCEYGEGEWWLGRLKIKWAIQAAALAQETAAREAERDDEQWRAQGWQGGHTEPEGIAVDVDDDDEAAA
jgi:hypothetical protein